MEFSSFSVWYPGSWKRRGSNAVRQEANDVLLHYMAVGRWKLVRNLQLHHVFGRGNRKVCIQVNREMDQDMS